MHSSFIALRHEIPVNNSRAQTPIDYSSDCQQDIHRIITIWQDCLGSHSGKFLIKGGTLADALYLPVTSGFNSNLVKVPEDISHYMNHLLSLLYVQKWFATAKLEREIIACEKV